MDLNKLKHVDYILNKYKLYYKNFDLTYVLRNQVLTALRTKENAGNKNVSINFKLIFRFLISILFFSRNLFNNYDYWVFSNAERRKKIGNSYYDRVASVVSDYSNQRTLFIESPTHSYHKFKTKDNILTEAILYLFVYIYNVFFFRLKFLRCNYSLIELEKELDISIQINSNVKKVIGQYFVLKFLLKFKKPKVVFVVFPDGYLGYIKALQELKIPVIELQHGVIYDSHINYNCYLEKDIEIIRSNAIFVYGKRDIETLIRIKYIDQENIYSIGSFMLWKTFNLNYKLSEYVQSITKVNKRNILVTTTVNDFDKLYDFVINVSKYTDEFNFLLLPRLSKKDNKNTSNVIVLDPHKVSAYELFTVSSFHLTIVSTCALEAIYFNLKSIVLRDSDVSFFEQNYPDIKELFYCNDIEGFLKLINNIPHFSNSNFNLFEIDIQKNFKNALINLNLDFQ